MLILTNFDSGELEIADTAGPRLRLTQDQAHRLVMAARMHTIDAFVAKLPNLIADAALVEKITRLFSQTQGSEQWNLKERFARLRTVSRDYRSPQPEAVFERVPLQPVHPT